MDDCISIYECMDMPSIMTITQLLLLILVVQSTEVSFAWIASDGVLKAPSKSTKLFSVPSTKNDDDWKKVAPPISTISSPWLDIICERYQDNRGQLLDYWRVEKDHSAVVLTIYRHHIVLPRAQYRPGLGHATLDFPGGRVSGDPVQAAERIVQRELGIEDPNQSIERLVALGPMGWPVNSSFSNQRLFGFVAFLNDQVELNAELLHEKRYNVNISDDLNQLLDEDLPCLQCRAVLMEWMLKRDRIT